MDTIGEVDWTLQGPGRISLPPTGVDIHYFAPLNSTNTTATVTATIHDAFLLYPPITKSVTFNILIPCGIEPYWLWDEPSGINGPPNYEIGGKSNFQCIILPDTVNFSSVLFRETVPEQTFWWPFGAPYIPPSGSNIFGVSDNYVIPLDIISPNVCFDSIDAEEFPIIFLYDWENGYQDCTFDVIVYAHFFSVTPTTGWTLFSTQDHKRKYYGDTQSCEIEDDADLYPPQEGYPMGPYQ
jgi:hypothetical protein